MNSTKLQKDIEKIVASTGYYHDNTQHAPTQLDTLNATLAVAEGTVPYRHGTQGGVYHPSLNKTIGYDDITGQWEETGDKRSEPTLEYVSGPCPFNF